MERSINPDVNTYIPRLADTELKNKLTRASTVLIEGPRGCGKTATESQIAKSEVFFDTDINARRACSIDANLVLAGETPRLFDERQLVPNLWNHVRRASDARRQKGNFILTGSAVPPDDLTRHSGAGRIARLQMRTMSMLELGLSSGKVSLRDMLAAKKTPRHVLTPNCRTWLSICVELVGPGRSMRISPQRWASCGTTLQKYVELILKA